jgi:hypothetical protein
MHSELTCCAVLSQHQSPRNKEANHEIHPVELRENVKPVSSYFQSTTA